MKQGQIFLRLCLWYCLSNLWELKILLCESCNKNNATIQLLKSTKFAYIDRENGEADIIYCECV